MSEEKALLAPTKEAARKHVSLLGSAAENGVRSSVNALAEAEQYGGTVIVIVTVPYKGESENYNVVQAVVSNCADQDVVNRTILEVALDGVVKNSDWIKTKEVVQ